MKSRLLVLLVLIFKISLSQDLGVIELDQVNSATLNFSEDIEFVVIGYNPVVDVMENGTPIFQYYNIFQSGRTVIFRSDDPTSPETTLTIQLINGELFTGKIKYKENPVKFFYDFTGQKSKEKLEKEKEEDKVKQVIKVRLEQVVSEKNKYLTFADVRNKVEFIVGNIKNDPENSYFKIDIVNNSSSKYIIDGVLFKHIEKKRRELKGSESFNEERLFPVVESNIREVGAYSKETLGYVIPLFSTGKKGKLQIQIIEKNGSRNAIIEISSREMAKIEVF